MKRVRLTVAYDGTNYCGWQVQANGNTVQAELNHHLSQLLQEEIVTMGASRTDAGVHALGNVAVFDTNARIPGEKISYALNQRLPEDIRIQCSEEVPKDFHPRYCESEKTYEYRILNRRFPLPTERFYSYFYHYHLNLEKMREGAAYLIGEHDFASFCGANAQVKTTVRTVTDIGIEKANDIVVIRVSGKGFLYNMVRIIAGTLIEIGNGAYPPQRMKEILEAADRETAGPTAPACGLTLVRIRFTGEPRDFA
jgi:tRNA pseudouridine38-40 synthase